MFSPKVVTMLKKPLKLLYVRLFQLNTQIRSVLTALYWPSITKYQYQYRTILTQYRQVPATTALVTDS